MLTEEQRSKTLARYHEQRDAWKANGALRALYADWYQKVASHLPDPRVGTFVEIGSGPGFARSFIPTMKLSDVVLAPWHDYEISADALPFDDGSVGALVLFDVLHHLADPSAFFGEATRVLARQGRIVLCEPFLSPLSFPVYRWLHEEPVILGIDPLAVHGPSGKDPFDSNQAIPTLLFDRRQGRASFAARFPELALISMERLAGPSYPASGGFAHAPLLPLALWRLLRAGESLVPAWAYRLIGFRMLAVIEKG